MKLQTFNHLLIGAVVGLGIAHIPEIRSISLVSSAEASASKTISLTSSNLTRYNMMNDVITVIKLEDGSQCQSSQMSKGWQCWGGSK